MMWPWMQDILAIISGLLFIGLFYMWAVAYSFA